MQEAWSQDSERVQQMLQSAIELIMLYRVSVHWLQDTEGQDMMCCMPPSQCCNILQYQRILFYFGKMQESTKCKEIQQLLQNFGRLHKSININQLKVLLIEILLSHVLFGQLQVYFWFKKEARQNSEEKQEARENSTNFSVSRGNWLQPALPNRYDWQGINWVEENAKICSLCEIWSYLLDKIVIVLLNLTLFWLV